MSLFKNKYRVETTRLKDWDYSNPGWYYVTICTREHKSMFGYIKNGKMFLNKIGRKVDEYWNEIPEHFTNVQLDEYRIMPDHFHGIVVLKPPGNYVNTKNNTVSIVSVSVETGYIPSTDTK